MITKLKFQKSTKNTHVYKNEDEGAPVSTLYIKRDALPNKPETIRITIEREEV